MVHSKHVNRLRARRIEDWLNSKFDLTMGQLMREMGEFRLSVEVSRKYC